MTSYTNPLLIPYPDATDSLKAAVSTIQQAQAQKINDLLAALSAVAPTAPATLTLGSGWTGTVTYARRAGITVVVLAAVKASYAINEVIATLPVGHRPAMITYASGQSGPNLRNFYVTTTGQITTNDANTNGIFGTVALAV